MYGEWGARLGRWGCIHIWRDCAKVPKVQFSPKTFAHDCSWLFTYCQPFGGFTVTFLLISDWWCSFLPLLLSGNMAPNKRQSMWQSRRVFFLTPQVLQNDLNRGSCKAEEVVLLVADEAHKALGNHAYCQVRQTMSWHHHVMITSSVSIHFMGQYTVFCSSDSMLWPKTRGKNVWILRKN